MAGDDRSVVRWLYLSVYNWVSFFGWLVDRFAYFQFLIRSLLDWTWACWFDLGSWIWILQVAGAIPRNLGAVRRWPWGRLWCCEAATPVFTNCCLNRGNVSLAACFIEHLNVILEKITSLGFESHSSRWSFRNGFSVMSSFLWLMMPTQPLIFIEVPLLLRCIFGTLHFLIIPLGSKF